MRAARGFEVPLAVEKGPVDTAFRSFFSFPHSTSVQQSSFGSASFKAQRRRFVPGRCGTCSPSPSSVKGRQFALDRQGRLNRLDLWANHIIGSQRDVFNALPRLSADGFKVSFSCSPIAMSSRARPK